MKIQNILLGFIMLAMFAMPLVLAVATEDISYFFEAGKSYDIKRECYSNGYPCNIAMYGCNLTVYYPNNTIYKNDTQMTGQSSFWNLTIYPTNGPLGTYKAAMYCSNGTHSGRETFYYNINQTGDNRDNTMFYVLGIVSIIILVISMLMKNEYIGIISGFLIAGTGVYVMITGMGFGLADNFSRMVSYGIIGLGAIIIIFCGYESIRDEE